MKASSRIIIQGAENDRYTYMYINIFVQQPEECKLQYDATISTNIYSIYKMLSEQYIAYQLYDNRYLDICIY